MVGFVVFLYFAYQEDAPIGQGHLSLEGDKGTSARAGLVPSAWK